MRNNTIKKGIKKGLNDDKENTYVDLSKNSVKISQDICSENLAKIYLKQKLYNRSIKIFKKLILKYPNKKDIFAKEISKIENKINKQK